MEPDTTFELNDEYGELFGELKGSGDFLPLVWKAVSASEPVDGSLVWSVNPCRDWV